MKKEKLKKISLFFVAFIAGTALILGSGYYKKTLAMETGALKVSLNGKDLKPISYDIKDEGLPKRLIQPGKISISSGHSPGILNSSKEPLLIKVEAEGFDTAITLDSTETSYDKKSGIFTKELQPGKGLNFSITLDIQRNLVNKKLVTSGNVIFRDVKSGNLIATLPVNVVNSGISN